MQVYAAGHRLVKNIPLGDSVNGANLASSQNMVVVEIQHRLGPLGFLVLPENNMTGTGTGGMNGYHDIIVGLRWIQANIGQFGGLTTQVSGPFARSAFKGYVTATSTLLFY